MDQPCHTGPAALVCGHCATPPPTAHHIEDIRLAWHDIACHAGPTCRYRTLCAQGQPTLTAQLARFLTRLEQLESA